MTKGNDGRAARRLLWKRLSVVLSCFVGVLVILNLLGIGGNSSSSSSTKEGNSTRRKSRMRGGGRARFREHQQQQRHKQGPQLIEVNNIDDDKVIRDKILSASVHLVDIDVDEDNVRMAAAAAADDGTTPSYKYSGVYGDFCQLNFQVHKQDPSSVPMFRDLVAHSPDCDRQRYRVDLSQVAIWARDYDNGGRPDDATTKVLDVGGVVFHESRCGSTLVANALIGMNPDKHRVYSESAPPIVALRRVCGENFASCNMEMASQVLKDTLYLMSRSNDDREERVFFKIQSVGTRSLELFQHALPTTPWMFVYRDPVQVLMSQLAHGSKHANCLQTKSQPPTSVRDIVARSGFRSVRQLTDEEYCAAHLASLTESAVAALERAPEMGVAVNYADLPFVLYTDILPNRWNIAVSSVEQDNIIKISQVYSKGRGSRAGESWHQDSERKEEGATPEIHKAADLFLQDSYDLLQGETQHDDVQRRR